MRPAMSLISGRVASPCGPRPRSVTLTPESEPFCGRPTMTIASAEPIGLPSAVLRTPGASRMVSALSRESVLPSSEVEPPRMTIARSARPVWSSAAEKPIAMASTEISTPTTPAMPTTMTSELPSREGMPCRLRTVTAPISLNKVIAVLPRVEIQLARECRRDHRNPQGPTDLLDLGWCREWLGGVQHEHHQQIQARAAAAGNLPGHARAVPHDRLAGFRRACAVGRPLGQLAIEHIETLRAGMGMHGRLRAGWAARMVDPQEIFRRRDAWHRADLGDLGAAGCRPALRAEREEPGLARDLGRQ